MKTTLRSRTRRAKLWSPKSAALALLAALSAIFVTACGKSDDGSAPYVPPVVGPTCVGCPGGTGSFLVSASGYSDVQQVQLGLDFFAQGAMVGMTATTSAYEYYGPVMAQGLFEIPIANYSCDVLPGRYQVRTVTPGVFGADGDSRTVEGLQMEVATSNGPLLITLNGYIDYSASPSVPSAIMGYISMTRSGMAGECYGIYFY